MNHIQKMAKKHKVIHEFSGKQHFFIVNQGTEQEHSVSVQVGCDCKYMGTQGIARSEICSHVLAVFEDILKHGNIKLTTGSEQMKQMKRNACLSLVIPSNRRVNEVRFYPGESKEHIAKKKEICGRLLTEGKHFVCEPIFITGGRADVLCLDNFTAYEVVKTETNESILRKQQEYPESIKIEVVRC